MISEAFLISTEGRLHERRRENDFELQAYAKVHREITCPIANAVAPPGASK
jgi:hypothetical protein